MAIIDRMRGESSMSVQVELTWLGQAGFLVRGPRATVLVDAFLSERPDRLVPPVVAPAALTGVDLVLCTHEHWDHFDAPAVAAVLEASPRARLVLPEPVTDQALAAGIPADRVVGGVPGTPVAVTGCTVHPVPAWHGIDVADAYGFAPPGQDGHRYLGYLLDLDGMRVFHAGDTLWYEGLADRLRELSVELALLPINGRDPVRERANVVGNMDHREAALLAAEAGARTLVPMHYEMFAGNRGYPSHLVDVVLTEGLELDVLVPRHGRPVVVTSER
jgi:L-ascorbate metabolism protein UlaG (beta-lactamase superfamily)